MWSTTIAGPRTPLQTHTHTPHSPAHTQAHPRPSTPNPDSYTHSRPFNAAPGPHMPLMLPPGQASSQGLGGQWCPLCRTQHLEAGCVTRASGCAGGKRSSRAERLDPVTLPCKARPGVCPGRGSRGDQGGQSPGVDSVGGPRLGSGAITGPSCAPGEVTSPAPTLPQSYRLPDLPTTATFLKAEKRAPQHAAGIGAPVPRGWNCGGRCLGVGSPLWAQVVTATPHGDVTRRTLTKGWKTPGAHGPACEMLGTESLEKQSTVVLGQGPPASQGTLGRAWRHSCVPPGGGQRPGCRPMPCGARGAPTTHSTQSVFPPTCTAPRLRSPDPKLRQFLEWKTQAIDAE